MGRFQKIFILLCFAFLHTLAKKKRHSPTTDENTIFGSEYDITINPIIEEFESTISKSNHLIFLYVFDSQLERSKQMNEMILKPIMDELKGYLNFVGFDCQNPDVRAQTERFKMCQDEEHTPFF